MTKLNTRKVGHEILPKHSRRDLLRMLSYEASNNIFIYHPKHQPCYLYGKLGVIA